MDLTPHFKWLKGHFLGLMEPVSNTDVSKLGRCDVLTDGVAVVWSPGGVRTPGRKRV